MVVVEMGVFAGSNNRCLGWWNWGGGGVVTVGSGCRLGGCVAIVEVKAGGGGGASFSTSDAFT